MWLMNNLIPLLDAYEAARAITDKVNLLRRGDGDVETAYHAAIVQEETAVEAADATLAAFQRGRWAAST